MRKLKQALPLIVAVATATLFLLAATRGQNESRSSPTPQQNPISQEILPREYGLEIIRVEVESREDDMYRMAYTVQNGSQQPITAFALGVGLAGVQKDYLIGVGPVQETLLPNATTTILLPLNSEEVRSPVRVAAVGFADGRFMGENSYITHFRAERIQLRNEIQHLLPITEQQLSNARAQRVSYEQLLENLVNEASSQAVNAQAIAVGNGAQVTTARPNSNHSTLVFELNRLRREINAEGDASNKLERFVVRLHTKLTQLGG